MKAISLLGTLVDVYGALNQGEHDRRRLAGIGHVPDPSLLDRLLDFPAAIPVADAVAWAELVNLASGLAEMRDDGVTVTRLLEPPLMIEHVVVRASTGRELSAVQAVSLFAGIARRWVSVRQNRTPGSVRLEASLYGVGIRDLSGQILLPAEKPVRPRLDGWTWLLREKVYGRWLSAQSQDGERGTLPPATGEAMVSPAG